ncbi:hypothetical protein ES705_15440 [subsurface metagenome]
MLIIFPFTPFSIICFPTAFEHKKTLVRFTFSTRSHSSRLNSMVGLLMTIPTLLTITSIRPKWSSTFATIFVTSSSDVTSTFRGSTSLPVFLEMVSATSCSLETCLSVAITRSAPASARASLKTRPRPCAAPVTMHTFPLSLKFSSICISLPSCI